MTPAPLKPAAILLLLWWGSSTLAADPAPATASWRVDPPLHDFGAISEMTPVSQDFLLLNEGTNELRVSEVTLSCERCLSYTLAAPNVAPGNARVLTVRFDPLGYQGDVDLSFVVRTEDAATPETVVRLRAFVESAFSVQGGPLVLLKVQTNEVRSAGVMLVADRRAEGPPLRHIATDYAGLAAHLETDPDGVTYRITATTHPPQPQIGLLRPRIFVFRSLDEPPAYAIPVTLEVIPPFHVSPREVVLDAVDHEQFRILFITQLPEAAVNLVDVELPNEHFRAEIIPEFDLPNYRINLYAYGLGGAEGMVDGIRILTKTHGDKTYTIPVRVRPVGSPEIPATP